MSKEIEEFKQKILDFFKENKRDFAWRKTHDPYKILVSEMMLQQTQTSRVVEKYAAFLKAFPTVSHLANASQADVLKLWQGLGYNRRALYLHQTAKLICEKYNETFPSLKSELVKLPGIGPNTAGAVIAFAYNRPEIFIETNIRRVYIHEFFREKENVNDQELYLLIKQSLDRKNPRNWYYALMDYGVHLGRSIPNPNRKSKHYKKQTKFEGSLRQVRGKILQELSKNNSLKIEDLRTKISSELFEKALSGLEKEGFLLTKNRIASLN